MHIHCLGLNHITASLDLLERLVFSEEQTRAALARLGCGAESQTAAIGEMVILSTCNRVELYTVSNEAGLDPLIDFLAELQDIPRKEFEPHLYQFLDQGAISHLFRVAAGLDSLVIGEPQILGQVTHALELARGQNAAGPLLSRLFQAAISAGKRVRTETYISRNPASISSLAASLAEYVAPPLDQAQIVVLGAGEMAELAVEALRKRGANRILVINRTLARADELAQRWGSHATTFEHIEAALASADILISSTGAPHTLIHPPLAAQVMQLRPERPMIMIDIAMPRDIDPDVASVPGVQLYDMDSLNQQLEQSIAVRLQEVPLAEGIIAEEESRFMAYLQTIDILPLIADLHQQAELIRTSLLEKTLRRLPDLNELEIERIDAMTQALVKRLLDAPIMRLRAEALCPYGTEYASVARTLFGLPTQDQTCYFTHGPCPAASTSALNI